MEGEVGRGKVQWANEQGSDRESWAEARLKFTVRCSKIIPNMMEAIRCDQIYVSQGSRDWTRKARLWDFTSQGERVISTEIPVALPLFFPIPEYGWAPYTHESPLEPTHPESQRHILKLISSATWRLIMLLPSRSGRTPSTRTISLKQSMCHLSKSGCLQ